MRHSGPCENASLPVSLPSSLEIRRPQRPNLVLIQLENSSTVRLESAHAVAQGKGSSYLV